ncbi:MAG: phosphodiester glycosidase family protein [Actinomycetota bacterium]
MRLRPRRLAAVPILLAILLVTLPAAEGRPGSHTRVRTIAPGVTLRTIVDVRIPRRTFVITVDPSQGARVEGVLAGGALGIERRLTTIAAGAGALAAINGDFAFPGNGVAVHPLVEDGELVRSAREMGGAFVLHTDGTVSIGSPSTSATVTEDDTGELWSVARWNSGDPAQGELAAFTDRGGSAERTPPFSCAARLQGAGKPGPTTSYVVETAGCFTGSLGAQGGLILAARPGTDEAAFLTSLTVGETLTVSWSVGFDDVRDLVGGGPVLLRDGETTIGGCSQPICGPNPRTAVGVTADGVVLLVVVDGRRAGYSSGMTLLALANLMRSLGAVDATNLDGGGSSTVVVQGDLMNRPSDGAERPVPSAIVVLPG